MTSVRDVESDSVPVVSEPDGASVSSQAATAAPVDNANEDYYANLMKLPPAELEKWKLQQVLIALQKEHDELEAQRRCTQCRTRPRDITFLPCGHFTMCKTCSEPIYECPSCNKDILATAQTFLS